ncbi:Protein kinase domain-containing protein [Mycena sanguinolenta]|uniref:Protein kinase domain-containing protein n=1 Tax=Mycena sanguinolenta TaxID=230812 RepID=A0A8H6XIY3_9AGAR|nr:Protein kinase domain-containing protein [Mycena sanguinolenta]
MTNHAASLIALHVCGSLNGLRISFHSVLEESREVREGDLDEPIKKLLGTLQQVAELLAKLAHQPFLKRYLKREETLRQIERCHTLLTDSVTIFSVAICFVSLPSNYSPVDAIQISVQIRVLKHIQAVERARVGMPAPTPADLSLGLENVEKNAKAASDTAVLRAIVEWNALENKQDSVRDAADLRAVLNLALTQNSDFEMLRILQLDRENLPEAVKILQRALEDAEAEVLPAYTPGVGPPEYAAIGADQKLLVGVIGALQRMSKTAVKKPLSPTESIASVPNLPEPDGPASSRSSLALSNDGSGSGASLELYDENGLLAEQHKERSYRILLQHDFHPSLSLPLWNPIPVSIGTVGYLDGRSGLFVTLFEIPSADRDAMTIKTRQYARRTAAQRGFDMLTGVVSSWISDTDSPSISHTYSHPLQRASYLIADPATCTYVDGTRTAKEWFKNNVDLIIREYGITPPNRKRRSQIRY